jgi:hypothetical protein
MRTVNWQRYKVSGVDDISPAEIDAILAAAEDSDSEIDFDVSELSDAHFDPENDDSE